MYASRHGYTYALETCVPDTSSEHTWSYVEQHRANWAKPEILLKHLETNHLVMYIDADAYVVDLGRTVEEFVESEGGDAGMIVTLTFAPASAPARKRRSTTARWPLHAA